jgi:cyclopropane fatty-acyl-phospholipid synthase-like methyltransferase
MSRPSFPPDSASAHRGRHQDPVAVPPWEIGRSQPAFRTLADTAAFRGRVLDVGCGTGEHALLAAGLGLDVTGVDINDGALRVAARKAAERGLAVRFQHLDARRLAELGDELFNTVLDCGLFHALEGADRVAYVAGLHAVLHAGGRFFMLCYSSSQQDVPHRVSLGDILDAFANGWQIDSVEPAMIDTNIHPAGARGWLARLTRTGAAAANAPNPDQHHRDTQGTA